MFDGKAFGQEVVAAVKTHVDKSLAPVLARLDAIEAKMKEPAAVDEEDLAVVKDEIRALRKAIADLSLPVDLPMVPALPDIPALVAEAVANQPPAEPGKSVTVEELAPVVAEAVQKAVAAIPAPKDGCGIKELLIDRDGNLVATMDDGRMKNLGGVVGRNGIDVDMAAVGRQVKELVDAIPKPKDGNDGFSLNDFDASLMDDGRTVLLSFEQGDVKHTVELGIPAMIYRGVYSDGKGYERGDTVTWAGSLWHCDEPTSDKPGEKSWTLAAKRGRDGKDGVVKADSGPPKVKV